MRNCIPEKVKTVIFFISAIIYLELIYRLWIFRSINFDFMFPVLFALSAGAIMSLLSGIFHEKANRSVSIIITALLTLCYGINLVYYCIFRTPLSLYSIKGAGDAFQLFDIVKVGVLKNIIAVLLLLVPLAFLLAALKKFSFARLNLTSSSMIMFFYIACCSVSILFVNLTGKSAVSQYTLYYETNSPELSVTRLGLLTTVRLDFERLVSGSDRYAFAEVKTGGDGIAGESVAAEGAVNAAETSVAAAVYGTGDEESSLQSAVIEAQPAGIIPADADNTMDIDFDGLITAENDNVLLKMHKYFSKAEPTKKNEYTGMFKGYNLIMMTAEGFSPYAVSPELTPTLYKMSTGGFVFKNFYNPIWGVSTSDGEYTACTGLIPKSGVWSFARSGNNHMPFALGNQFKELGYVTRAYHNHTYTYYKRNISHPNMGYEYKGIGNGLEIKKTWPESDLEMIEATAPEYIGGQPFHTYYMTVSGHMNYSFSGNHMAQKNREYVAGLPLSDSSKAYIACNMELEFALKALIEKLEVAGIADRTVIAISPDHYPYGLSKECIDELAGHKVESNFELYKSIFILWTKGMEPVVVEKPSSSIDITPTLLNLFGLEYDSRLMMGRDILSSSPPLVIFSNRSWITDRAMYNAAKNSTVFTDGGGKDADYVKATNKEVADKFEYSAKILETDYYGKVLKGIKSGRE